MFEKELADFNKRTSAKSGYSAHCRDCNRAQLKSHYENNPDYYLLKNDRLKRERRAQVDAIKENNPCADCGGYFPAIAMDFDHINDDKVKIVRSQRKLIVGAQGETIRISL